MATPSSLRTALAERLGVTVLSAAETNILDQCINMAIAKAAAEGAPEFRQAFSGYTLSTLSTTVSSHTATNTYLVVASATGVYPGDILNDTANSKSYLIRTVNGTTLDLGIPLSASINGNSVTITRRSLPLPTTGVVWEARLKDAQRPLEFSTLVSAHAQFQTGTPTHFTQTYAETGDVSLISFYPAPSSSMQVFLVQTRGVTEDGTIYVSEALRHHILANAQKFRMLMAGGAQGAMLLASEVDALRVRGGAGGHNIVLRG